MTPQLLQAIKLLQLSHLDLVAYVEAELERNPLLERPSWRSTVPAATPPEARLKSPGPTEIWLERISIRAARSSSERPKPGSTTFSRMKCPFPLREAESDGEVVPLTPSPWSGGSRGFDDDGPDLEATLARETSLFEHLERQLDLATADPQERLIGRHLINGIDEAGYLPEVDRGRCRAPRGADGRRRRGSSRSSRPSIRPASAPATSPNASRSSCGSATASILPWRRFLAAWISWPSAILRRCGASAASTTRILAEMLRRNPPARTEAGPGLRRRAGAGARPGRHRPPRARRQLVHRTQSGHPAPGPGEPDLLRPGAQGRARDAEKAFLTDCLQSANWLTRSLEQRAKTILKVAAEIVRLQDGFFRHGVAHLRPLNLKTVADEIGMHESTVSRVTSNKAIGTKPRHLRDEVFLHRRHPRRAWRRGAFFGGRPPPHQAAHRLEKRPMPFCPTMPWSRNCSGEGIDIARRTVAKYRESLRIPSSIERRREKQMQRRAS